MVFVVRKLLALPTCKAALACRGGTTSIVDASARFGLRQPVKGPLPAGHLRGEDVRRKVCVTEWSVLIGHRTFGLHFVTKKKSVALVRERTIPTERPPPVGEVSANFLQIEGCHVVSATDPHGR